MDSKLSASTSHRVKFGSRLSRVPTSRTRSSTNRGRSQARSVTYFSSGRLSSAYRSQLADSSISAIRSSIQKKRSNHTFTDTRLRWLCAPFRLIALLQGQSVVTGTWSATQRSWSSRVTLAPPVQVEQLDEAAHVRALALGRHRDAHVDLGDGVLQAPGPVEHADRIAQPLHAGAIQREAAIVPLALHVAQRGQAPAQRGLGLRYAYASRFHSSSSPRRMVTAFPPMKPRTLPGPWSGLTSTSTRPGRPISSPWVKTSRRGIGSGSIVWISAPSCPAALPVTGSSRIP